MINVFQPDLGTDEAAAVSEVLASGWVGRGPRTAEFEARFAEHLEVPAERVTSTNSCSEGLFLAMELAGVGPGDEVVLPTISFVGAGNAIASRGARPVLCDVDARTLNPSVADVEAAMGPRTRAVIVLHYGGAPGDLLAIAELCRRRGVLLVEDAACAVASRVGDRAVGTVGDIGLWSFDGAKVVVTGDGGMLTARDPELVARARKLAYFGLEQFSGYSQAAAASKRWWDFQISSFSRRSVTNDIAAAIGLVQMRRLPGMLRRREEIARRYDDLFAGSAVVCPPALPADHVTSNYFYWVQLPADRRDDVASRLLSEDVYTTFRYAPLHRVEAYGWDGAPLPGAERAADRTLCLPIHSSLTDEDVDLVAKILLDALPAPGTEEDSR
jgi:aminotransferase